jgi:hypothetical protein
VLLGFTSLFIIVHDFLGVGHPKAPAILAAQAVKRRSLAEECRPHIEAATSKLAVRKEKASPEPATCSGICIDPSNLRKDLPDSPQNDQTVINALRNHLMSVKNPKVRMHVEGEGCLLVRLRERFHTHSAPSNRPTH